MSSLSFQCNINLQVPAELITLETHGELFEPGPSQWVSTRKRHIIQSLSCTLWSFEYEKYCFQELVLRRYRANAHGQNELRDDIKSSGKFAIFKDSVPGSPFGGSCIKI